MKTIRDKFRTKTESIDSLLNQAKTDGWTELSLSGSSLTSVPADVFKLVNLNKLDLSNNPITHLPPDISKLYNLQTLILSSTKLSQLPLGLGLLINLKKLELSKCYFLDIPESIFNLENLALLHLDANWIVEISPDIEKLKNLRVLTVSHNKIYSLPTGIGQLHQLRFLNLEGNELATLPMEFRFLRSLRSLDLSHNKFNRFPKILRQLKNLRVLRMSHVNIYELPAKINNLQNLKELDLDRCGLAVIPPEISMIRTLEKLILSRNNLKSLPSGINDLTQLKYLDLHGNQLSTPPEILKIFDNPRTVLDYYFSSLGANKYPINEVKLLLVGQGSVGKTSIITRLIQNTFTMNQTKTDGISISRWHMRDKQSSNALPDTATDNLSENHLTSISINIWDFGGQEIMHATHQFFLTKRSLYLLVLDSRLTQEENRVEYWLKIIQSFGGESPVLIVGNKIDQHPLDIDRTGLQKKYPNIVGILATSAATGAGTEELKAAIAEQVNHMPHVRDLLPETWFTIKTKLEGLGRESNFITHDKYIELCNENEVTDETSQRTLIGFLHDLGVILHFQDDPRLEALGILNPQWVTNGVYKILNSHALFQNKGVLTVSMLDDILNLPEYPRGKRLFIVDMMKKFELCYDIEADKTFLVPDLLPKDEPVTDGHENTLTFQYHYTVLPSSVITRFIVRMNEFIQEQVWRSGVVLKGGGSTALVKADAEDRKVFIWVGGEEHKRHDFLSKIRGQFDAIHKTISKLEVKEMVPVPGHPEADPVDYDLLLQMDHNNVEVYPVLSGGKMIVVKVREMLNGVARQEDRQRGNITNVYIGGNLDGNMIIGDENVSSKS